MTELRKIQKERDNEAETLYSELLLSKDTYDTLKNTIKQARILGYTWGDIGFALSKITSDAISDAMYDEDN